MVPLMRLSETTLLLCMTQVQALTEPYPWGLTSQGLFLK